MKKKSKWILLLCFLCFCCFAVISFLKNINAHQSENAYESESKTCDEGGMYYFSGADYLMYMDNATGSSAPVCTRANCTHSDDACDACYMNVVGQRILLYDDSIYVSYFTIEYTTDSSGNQINAGVSRIERSNKDGSERKVIYECENGAVLSMLAVDGVLYFTVYGKESMLEDAVEYNVHNEHLYKYQMDWKTTKEILCYEGDETHYNSSLFLIPSEDKDRLYLQYTYARQLDTEGQYNTEFITIDLDGVEQDNILIEDTLYKDYNIKWASEDAACMTISEWTENFESEVDACCIWTSEQGITQLISYGGKESCNYKGSGYYLLGRDDFQTQRVLLDMTENKYYESKCFHENTGSVPDIWMIDREHDTIYYDATDYTGVANGTIYDEDPTDAACMKWSDFLDTYFIEKEDADIDGFEINKDEIAKQQRQ